MPGGGLRVPSGASSDAADPPREEEKEGLRSGTHPVPTDLLEAKLRLFEWVTARHMCIHRSRRRVVSVHKTVLITDAHNQVHT